MPDRQTLSVPATLPGVQQALEAFDGFAGAHQIPQGDAWRFSLALDEMLSNIVRHGGGAAPIDLMFSLDARGLGVEIVDRTEAFNPLEAPPPDTSSGLDRRQPGGQGIALVRQLMDETAYERRNDRNHFTMRRGLPHANQ
jgi:serine/threonine-protein kinase RsbW